MSSVSPKDAMVVGKSASASDRKAAEAALKRMGLDLSSDSTAQHKITLYCGAKTLMNGTSERMSKKLLELVT